MECKEIKELINNWKFLDSVQWKLVEEHISDCADCKSFFEETQRTFAMLDDYQVAGLPEKTWIDFNDDFWEKVERKERRNDWAMILRPALSFIFVVFLVVSSVFISENTLFRSNIHMTNYSSFFDYSDEDVYSYFSEDDNASQLGALLTLNADEIEIIEEVVYSGQTLDEELARLSDESTENLLTYLENWEGSL